MSIARKLIAEFIGTLVIVVAATAPIVMDAQTSKVGIVGIAFSPGVGVALMVYAFAKTSGAHFNPAVSLGLLISRSITAAEFLLYLLVQILAALLASIVVLYTIGSDAYLGANSANYNFGLVEVFAVEIFLTFLLMSVIFAVVHTRGLRGFGGAAIGLIVGLDIFFGANISGASMNPARSLGPALVSNSFGDLWIYWSATFIGAALSALMYAVVKSRVACRKSKTVR
jgi:aquaporin Z